MGEQRVGGGLRLQSRVRGVHLPAGRETGAAAGANLHSRSDTVSRPRTGGTESMMTMRTNKFRVLPVLAILTALVFPALAQRATFTGKVVRVYDGDNARIERTINGRAVVRNYRIAGIDAPERSTRQPYWQASQQQLAQLIVGKEVVVEVRGRDTVWKRPLAVIKVGGVDAGLEQVKNGAAWYLPLYGRSLTAEEKAAYAQAYAEAKAAKRGLWASANPIEPRIWRKRMREARQQRSN